VVHDVAMRRILVGYDGSDGGRRALDRAVAEARDSHGRIVVLSVASLPLSPDAPRHFGTLDDISVREGATLAPPPDVVEYLTEARNVLAGAGHDAELTWAAGEPAHAIVEAAARIRAGVIVLGEHHHGFLSSLFGADVAAEVQRAAGCDVILA
jgi:nucleotide-binding universal stress UspA family protein